MVMVHGVFLWVPLFSKPILAWVGGLFQAPATQQAPQTAADCCNYLCSLASKTPGGAEFGYTKSRILMAAVINPEVGYHMVLIAGHKMTQSYCGMGQNLRFSHYFPHMGKEHPEPATLLL